MNAVVYWSLLIFSPLFPFNGGDADDYSSQAYYDIIRNDKIIGYMVCSKVERGDMVEYTTESSARISMLFDVSVYSKLQTSFCNDLLRDGKLTRLVNGKTKSSNHIVWNTDRYLVNNNGKRTLFTSKINFSTACLMYVEPLGMRHIFSENFGQYVTIKEISPHQYVLRLPDGNDNLYTYSDGKCIEVEVRTSFATVYIRPGK